MIPNFIVIDINAFQMFEFLICRLNTLGFIEQNSIQITELGVSKSI